MSFKLPGITGRKTGVQFAQKRDNVEDWFASSGESGDDEQAGQQENLPPKLGKISFIPQSFSKVSFKSGRPNLFSRLPYHRRLVQTDYEDDSSDDSDEGSVVDGDKNVASFTFDMDFAQPSEREALAQILPRKSKRVSSDRKSIVSRRASTSFAHEVAKRKSITWQDEEDLKPIRKSSFKTEQSFSMQVDKQSSPVQREMLQPQDMSFNNYDNYAMEDNYEQPPPARQTSPRSEQPFEEQQSILHEMDVPVDEDYDSEPLPKRKSTAKRMSRMLLTQSDSEEPQSAKKKAAPRKDNSIELKIYQKGGLKEVETEDGNVVRRSNRMRYKPLEYWRNERVKFGRRKSGPFPVPVIHEIVRVPEDEQPKRRKVSRKQKDSNINPTLSIMNPLNEQEIERDVLAPPVDPKYKRGKNGSFQLAKVISDPFNPNLCAGMMKFERGDEKPLRLSGNITTICYVITGEVEVSINGTTTLMPKGSSFLIPKGNQFKIANNSPRESRIFFVNERSEPKMKDEDEDM